jgi:hypothetical protein
MRRLVSPAGFVLVGLLFLLPFLTVSCSDGPEPMVNAVFDGTDLLTGGDPDVVTFGEANAPDQDPAEFLNSAKWALGIESFDRQPFAIAAAAVLLFGVLTALIRERMTRHASALGIAVLSGALLVATFLRAAHAVDQDLVLVRDGVGRSVPHTTTPAVGFWLMIGTLALLVIGHAMALARAWPTGRPTADATAAPEVT